MTNRIAALLVVGITAGCARSAAFVTYSSSLTSPNSTAKTVVTNPTSTSSQVESTTVTKPAVTNLTYNSATITWTSSTAATGVVNYGLSATTRTEQATQTGANSTSHSVTLTDLAPSTIYYFQVYSSNTQGEASWSSTLTTSTAPQVVLTAPSASNINAVSATISWTSNIPASSLVNYGLSASSEDQQQVLPATDSTTHSVVISGLTPGSKYYYQVVSSGYGTKASWSSNFTTIPAVVLTAPSISNLTPNSATISWTSNIAASGLVNYGSSAAAENQHQIQTAADSTAHAIALTGLQPGSKYFYQVVSSGSGTAASWSSNFTTPPLAVSSGSSRTLPAYFWGTNIENQFGGGPYSWSDPDTASAVKDFGYHSLRFPGGAVGNYWDWQANQTYAIFPTSDANDTLSNFATLALGSNSIPTFCLNVMTSENAVLSSPASSSAISNQIALLEQAQKLGLPIQLIELGNEFYLGSSSASAPVYEQQYYQRFPTGSAYGQEMNTWATKIKAAYPAAKIAAVGYDVGLSWNQAVVSQFTTSDIDAMTIHRYESVGDYTDATNLPAILANAFTSWQTVQNQSVEYFKHLGLSTWVTEYDLMDQSSDIHFAALWVHGLYDAVTTLQFLADPRIAQTSIYNLHSSSKKFSLVYSGTESFGTPARTAEAGALSATGNVMALIGQAIQGASRVAPLTLANAPQVSPASGETSFTAYPAIIGVKIDYPSPNAQSQYIVVNLSGGALPLQIGSGSATLTSVSSSSLGTYVLSSTSLTSSKSTVSLSNLTVPAYSISRIVP